MNYAAERHFVSPGDALPGADDTGGLPWETGSGATPARHDTWLLSFIDILALLLTLFVLLLAFQDSEMKLAKKAPPPAQSFSTDFNISLGALGRIFRLPLFIVGDASVSEGYAMPGQGLLPVDTDVEQAVPGNVATTELAKQTPEEPRVEQTVGGSASDDGRLVRVEEESTDVDVQADTTPNEVVLQSTTDTVDVLLEVFEASELRDKVEVAIHPGEVNLEISDSILFSRASAALTDEGQVLLKDLAEALSGQPYVLSVEGHTDNIPIETARYPSNWELSSARAAVVTRKLIEHGIASDKVRAIGYGATRPLADNTTPEGRARNRRVSFVMQVDVKESSQVEVALRRAPAGS